MSKLPNTNFADTKEPTSAGSDQGFASGGKPSGSPSCPNVDHAHGSPAPGMPPAKGQNADGGKTSHRENKARIDLPKLP